MGKSAAQNHESLAFLGWIRMPILILDGKCEPSCATCCGHLEGRDQPLEHGIPRAGLRLSALICSEIEILAKKNVLISMQPVWTQP